MRPLETGTGRLREEFRVASRAASEAQKRACDMRDRFLAEHAAGTALTEAAERCVDLATARFRAACERAAVMEERVSRGRSRAQSRAAEKAAAEHEARRCGSVPTTVYTASRLNSSIVRIGFLN